MNFNNRTFHLLLKADILTCYEQPAMPGYATILVRIPFGIQQGAQF